jgi:hypothetical protein
MAITSKRQMVSGQGVELSVARGRATRTFRVYDDAGAYVLEADALAYLLTTYPLGQPLASVPGLQVVGHTLTPMELASAGTLQYQAEVEYENPAQGGPLDPLPWNRPPQISLDASADETPFFEDASTPTKKKVVNAAGEPFSPMPTALQVEATVRFVRNLQPGSTLESTILNMALAQDGKNAFTNSDSFTLMGRSMPAFKTVMWISGMRRVYEGQFTYWEASFGFKIYGRGNAVDLNVANLGYSALVAGNLEPVMFGGITTPVPVHLAADGELATPTEPVVFLTFKVPYTPVPFSQLGFL